MNRLNWNAGYRRTAVVALWVSVPVLAALAGNGCSGHTSADSKGAGGPGGRGDFAVPVTAAKASQKDVPVQAQVIGAVEAYSMVSLKAQISGQLMEANFKEGDSVKAGQLMFTLDPRLLEAQVKQTEANILRDVAALGQSEANLSRDRAQQLNARTQRDRWAALYKEGGIISKEQFETYEATAASFDATVKADEAAIENAKAQIAASRASLENQKIQLSYTKIYAPIGGRTGAILVKPGNIVTANTTELATINQVQPVFVSFSLPETFLPALRKNSGGKLPVRAVSEDGTDTHAGVLAFFDNAVDTTTGTIRLKATFPNEDRKLWPGQFLRVTLDLDRRPNAILVPSLAIQSGQEGPFLYVIKDQKVEVRKIVAGQRVDQETVVEKGIEPGETVVTEGTLRLFPGAKVQVREPGQAPGAGRGGKRS